MIPIVVLASGRGSNYSALQKARLAGKLKADIRAVITDNPDAGVISKAKADGVQTILLPFPEVREGVSIQARRQEHEALLLKELRSIQPRFLVFAGYMRIITSQLIEAFRSERGYSRLVNIHPSLLPAFPGVHSYAQAFHYGVKVTGITVHLVEAEVDQGPICAQEAFTIEDCKSEDEVEKRGLAVEHRLYPETLDWVLREDFKLEYRSKRRLCVCSN
jgi:phosphoribosylglycinamide formyltransferase 1